MNLLTVTELTTYLREWIDSDDLLRDIWVEGEVSNFNRHSSGHCYLTLKHGDTQISAVAWKSYAARMSQLPGNGDAVLAHGRVAFYEGRGQLQMIVDDLRPAGIGVLQAQFERLRSQLEAEGLFDQSRKRPIPALPARIGLVTSPTSAALQDMLTVLGRRFPLAEVLIAPCKVQGAGAAETVVEALYALYDLPVDVIIVARGGGSTEDLWAFNEEIVARAVFASPVPVVSGVGHETDTTIIDWVADLRAPTPSAAAEIVTPDRSELIEATEYLRERMEQAILGQIAERQIGLAQLHEQLRQRTPLTRIARDRELIAAMLRRCEQRVGHQLALAHARLDGAQGKLASLNPLGILGRGYAVVRRADGTVVTAPAEVLPSELLRVTLRGGDMQVRVEG
jgi:exodeoxyribonuclease VII large subunit